MSLNLICIDCRNVLRSAEHMRRGRCDSCYDTHNIESARAANEALELARLMAEVHEVCTECGVAVEGHRARSSGICAVCLDKRSKQHTKAKSMYMDVEEAKTVPCPTCGAAYGKHCMDGTGSKARMADSPHTARKVAVLDQRARYTKRLERERAAIAEFGEWRTIDGFVIYPGMAVWNYNLDQDRVVSLDNVERHPDHPNPEYRAVAWWRTSKGSFDGSRLWVLHPTTGKRCGA